MGQDAGREIAYQLIFIFSGKNQTLLGENELLIISVISLNYPLLRGNVDIVCWTFILLPV